MMNFIKLAFATGIAQDVFHIGKEGAEAVFSIWRNDPQEKQEQEATDVLNAVYASWDRKAGFKPETDRFFTERLNPVLSRGLLMLIKKHGAKDVADIWPMLIGLATFDLVKDGMKFFREATEAAVAIWTRKEWAVQETEEALQVLFSGFATNDAIEEDTKAYFQNDVIPVLAYGLLSILDQFGIGALKNGN